MNNAIFQKGGVSTAFIKDHMEEKEREKEGKKENKLLAFICAWHSFHADENGKKQKTKKERKEITLFNTI